MNASRTWAGLRQASSSHHANNFATLAKKASTEVVDNLVNSHNNKRLRSSNHNDDSTQNTTWLAHEAAMASSDFGTDMGDFAPGGFLSDIDADDEDLNLFESIDAEGLDLWSDNNSMASSIPSSPSAASFASLRTPDVSVALDKKKLGLMFDFPSQAVMSSVFTATPRVAPVKAESPPSIMDSSMLEQRQPILASVRPPKRVSYKQDDSVEREFEKKIALATKRGDTAAIRQIKNGREKVRRAKMCTKFEELHDVVTITNQMMALSTTGSASPLATAAAAVAARNASAAASAAAALKSASMAKMANSKKRPLEKKKNFKKAEVLHNAIETIKEMQAQIEALAQRNALLEKQAVGQPL